MNTCHNLQIPYEYAHRSQVSIVTLNLIIVAKTLISSVQFSHSLLSDSANPWTAAYKTSLPITSSWSWLKPTSPKSVMRFNHLIPCHSLLLLLSVLPSIRVFSNESVLCIRWPKYWSFSFSISPSNEYSGRTDFLQD